MSEYVCMCVSEYVCECVDRRLIFRDWLVCVLGSVEIRTQGRKPR